MVPYWAVDLGPVALALRALHLTTLLFAAGTWAALLLAGPPPRPTAVQWEATVLRAGRGLVLGALLTGLGLLVVQAAQAEGRLEAAFEGSALARFALETLGGRLALVRLSLLALLVGWASVRGDTRRVADWIAARGEAGLLALAAVVALTSSGHAAAMPDPTGALLMGGLHAAPAGLWAGALAPLAGLLARAAREAGADARPYAVLAVRRFSRLALPTMVVVVGSGLWNARTYVGSLAGLVGTSYGRLLLVKLGLLVAILGLAVVNRRCLPRLSEEAATRGRPALRRLAALMRLEAALAAALLAVVAGLTLTPPARHLPPSWPFPVRLTLDALETEPGRPLRALAGSQMLVLGLVMALASARLRRRRWPALAAGGLLGAVGLALLGPALSVDAYPTTFWPAAVPYTAASIAQGATRFSAACATCHGPEGRGDGPEAYRLPRRPADLRSAALERRTAGDLFWWISRGRPGAGMPGFADRLDDEARWELVNFLRALGASARPPGPRVEPNRPRVVAPDFSFAVGPLAGQSLRAYRGRRLVLLVLYTLPGSRARLAQLAANYAALSLFGLEVIAVPRDLDPDPIRRLGADPPVLFPVVTEGAREIVTAYGLFARGPHAEFLIDRGGYVRALSTPAGDPAQPLGALLAAVQALNDEGPATPAGEHVH
jgi:putative copper resistance protein D